MDFTFFEILKPHVHLAYLCGGILEQSSNSAINVLCIVIQCSYFRHHLHEHLFDLLQFLVGCGCHLCMLAKKIVMRNEPIIDVILITFIFRAHSSMLTTAW